jgi:hypothetical protein
MATDLLEAPDAPKTSLVTEVLFPLPAVRRTPLGILTWWESRRLVYNLIVGAAGLVTLSALGTLSLIPPGLGGPRVLPPLLPILAYGALANACYTLGPAIEIALQKIWKDKVLPVGPALYRQGIAFSVGLTLLPIVVGSGAWVVRLGAWLFGAL